MKRRILLLVVVTLLITACSRPTGGGIDTNFRVGVGELEMQFTDISETLYEEREFAIPVVIENTAAYDIKDATVELNTNQDLFTVYQKEFLLGTTQPGKDGRIISGLGQFNPVPDRTDILFEGYVNQLTGQDREPTTPNMILTYSSHMIFEPTVCIGSSLLDIDDGGCRVEDTSKSYSGQGAPVAITKMETKVFAGHTGQMQFTMRIKNKGEGQITALSLGETRIGNRRMECFFPDGQTREQNIVEFHEGKKETTLICTIDVPHRASFSSPMYVVLEYGYMTVQNLKLKLLKTGVEDNGLFS
jgi:hypothetical protein